ncbi:MAG: 50S ribosomal protein L28 [Bacteroidales bacterium OttesenSCG-928-I14]|jgi:large subunit ribosomal protein L28|nr:50S ribosomal protein L28 [Bacteroidales bacterium OttesenSCG-928-I14]
MSKICQITDKRVIIGNSVAHSNHKTKRKFNINFSYKRLYWAEKDCWINIGVSSSGLRTINKIGLNEAIKKSKQKVFTLPVENDKKSKRK